MEVLDNTEDNISFSKFLSTTDNRGIILNLIVLMFMGVSYYILNGTHIVMNLLLLIGYIVNVVSLCEDFKIWKIRER